MFFSWCFQICVCFPSYLEPSKLTGIVGIETTRVTPDAHLPPCQGHVHPEPQRFRCGLGLYRWHLWLYGRRPQNPQSPEISKHGTNPKRERIVSSWIRNNCSLARSLSLSLGTFFSRPIFPLTYLYLDHKYSSAAHSRNSGTTFDPATPARLQCTQQNIHVANTLGKLLCVHSKHDPSVAAFSLHKIGSLWFPLLPWRFIGDEKTPCLDMFEADWCFFFPAPIIRIKPFSYITYLYTLLRNYNLKAHSRCSVK